ncbi:hypothetical protein [Acidiferrobacter sp.]|jgi:hypothetical protein|uniref:hypothetical protein n=2 Tax=Acidiferrobacter sp. TaxID=1872107 RepID=UPI00261D5D47|nr:hypothetical protein [Acidiferrobacter sp.]
MKKTIVSFVVVGLAMSPVFAKPLRVPLMAENGSGESGYAMLYPHGARTNVVVHLRGTPNGIAQPDHIHAGTCPNVNPKPAYMLKPVKHGTSVTMVHASLKQLLATPMAINVHESPSDLRKYVACGDIRAH